MTALAVAPPQLGEKFAALPFVPCTMADLRRYAEASGDENPIHLDEALAKKAGLPGCPVHGMLLLARFVPALATWHRDLKLIRIGAKFLRPIYAGESGELSGRVAQITADTPARFVLRLMAHNEKRELALVAEAVTILKSR